ncbi:MAG: sigma 54-interacting transcriptional regulator [Kofleriaceae bacterium]
MDVPAELADLTARLAAAPDDDRRAALAQALGEGYRDRGEAEPALQHLTVARDLLRTLDRPADAARVEVTLAEVCTSRGDGERALTLLDGALDLAEAHGDEALAALVQLALGEAAAARGDDATATALLTAAEAAAVAVRDRELHARAAAALARVLARRGRRDEAHRLITGARAEVRIGTRPAIVATVLAADAEVRQQAGDGAAAVVCWREVIDLAAGAGLRRVEAEACLALGLALGGHAGRTDDGLGAASYLARAHELFRAGGSLRDLERVREAFRRFGRRATDRVPTVELTPLLAELRRHRQAVTDAVARARVEPALRTELDGSLAAMAGAAERLATAATAVVVDRENIRGLLELIRSLAQITDFAQLPTAVARLACQLVGGDRAVVRLAGAREGAIGVTAAAPGPWHGALDLALAPAARPTLLAEATADARGDDAQAGALAPTLTAPLRVGASILGALWVDRTPSGGVFTERDLDLVAAFASQAAAIVDRARAADELRLAARTTATTLAAIGDGVLAIDPGGRLTAINPAAARLLGLTATVVDAPDQVELRARPDTRAVAAALEEAVARGDDLDGRAVPVGATELLVSTRLVKDDRGATAGLVATLTELRRAQTLAHRIVGTSARYTLDALVGDAPAVRHVRALAEAAAGSDAAVLLTGESGTGKEVLAQAIHNASARAAGPFVAINCAAIPRDLLESELFGYEAGAFTGARRGGRPGKFELAEGGTLLLDEVGDMPLDMQVKLLRVLQEKTVSRLGGARELSVTGRIIATTNRELDDDVARGLFRRDLFYRLRVIHIPLPPLRDRPGDVAALTAHFLSRHARAPGHRVLGVSPAVAAALAAHPWPGNVRELEHVIESAVALAPSDATIIEVLPVDLGRRQGGQPPSPTPAPSPTAVLPAPPSPAAPPSTLPTAAAAERALFEAALARYHGRIPLVARALGLARATVYNRVRRYQLELARYRDPD